MEHYTFLAALNTGDTVTAVSSERRSIPLDPDNTDYQQFLKDWEAGATVLSSTGSPLAWGSDPS